MMIYNYRRKNNDTLMGRKRRLNAPHLENNRANF